MDGLAHTSRGVLGSALLLLIVGGIGVWSLNKAAPPGTQPASAIGPLRATTARMSIADAGWIRVALTQRTVSSVRLKVDGPFCVTSLGTPGSSIDVPRSFAEDVVTAMPGGIKFCGRTWDCEGIEITPVSSPAIWLDGRKYRGRLRLYQKGSQLRAVNVLPLEEYVAAVVDAEMPAAFPVAAREAQAIAARTYAVSCRIDPANALFDLYATPVSQNYLGVVYEDSRGRLLAGETAGGRAAAEATANLICTRDGRPFRAYYSACCGGRTFFGGDLFDDADALHAVKCDGCNDAPLYRWRRSITDESAMRRLAQLARSRAPAFRTVASAKTIGDATAPAVVDLSDGVRRVRLPATEVRRAIDLPSLSFDLTADRDLITVTGRGHGHGVGLCQWGAKGLAERGLSCAEILQHYYTGCEFSQLAPEPSPRFAEAGGMPPAGRESITH